DAFEQTCPTARPVFEAVRDELFELLAANTGDQATLDALLVKTRELHEPLKARLEQGRDRLLEIHSSGGAAAQQLVDKLAAEDGDTGMISFALKMFDEIGVNQDDRGENALVLTPGDHMLVSSFPGLPQDGMTITFDRPTALSRDDMALLCWDHPMMRGGIDLILGSEIGATSVALLKNKALPIGSILLELIFVAESAAHPQLYRFMPPTPIRLLMDKNGQNLGEKVAFDAFNRQLTPVNRHLGSKLVTASQPVIHGLIGKGQPIAEELKAVIVDKARAQMAQTLQQDLDRLEALKAVNPSVRDSELDYLRDLQAELHHLIDQTQLKLDAIRFIVVTHN
ncbi:MAG: RNA polymerase-associated protein RapA, partial [Aeromonas sobria]